MLYSVFQAILTLVRLSGRKRGFFSHSLLSYLEVHEVEEFVDLGREHLHSLLVDLHAIRLLVRLGLRERKIVVII